MYLRGLSLTEKYGAPLQARCTNLLRKLNDQYDAVLREVDVLLMPTIIYPPTKIRTQEQMRGGEKEMGPLGMLSRTIGATYNTAPFKSSGHPALSLPVSFVPSAIKGEEGVRLPTGLQSVGRKFEDLLVLKVGASWEKAFDWKTLEADGS
jgi:amidase